MQTAENVACVSFLLTWRPSVERLLAVQLLLTVKTYHSIIAEAAATDN
jgi:hypothetical protein